MRILPVVCTWSRKFWKAFSSSTLWILGSKLRSSQERGLSNRQWGECWLWLRTTFRKTWSQWSICWPYERWNQMIGQKSKGLPITYWIESRWILRILGKNKNQECWNLVWCLASGLAFVLCKFKRIDTVFINKTIRILYGKPTFDLCFL